MNCQSCEAREGEHGTLAACIKNTWHGLGGRCEVMDALQSESTIKVYRRELQRRDAK